MPQHVLQLLTRLQDRNGDGMVDIGELSHALTHNPEFCKLVQLNSNTAAAAAETEKL